MSEREKEEMNKKGWVKVEAYMPEKLKVFKPNTTIKVSPNDKALLEIQKVTLEDGTVITEQKEDIRVWCCDDEPEIKALSEGVRGRKLGEFLQIKCPAIWGYPIDKSRSLGIPDDSVIIFWVWLKEVDPYLQHEPKCCTIL